jgi:hypothetical protein
VYWITIYSGAIRRSSGSWFAVLLSSTAPQSNTKSGDPLVHLILVLVVLALLLGGRVLVLLVLGHEVVHVGLRLGELHLVHALAGVPVQEGLAAEHGGELLGHALEHLLDGGGVAQEGDGHLEAFGGISQTDALTLLGIHSTKYEEFLLVMLSICSSTFLVGMRPRKSAEQVR